MAVTLEKNLESANLKDTKKEVFSSIDLKEFTDLVKTEDDFKELIKGFEKQETIDAMKTAGIQDVVKNYVETSKKLTDLANIFDKEYKDIANNQDIYEVCVLGALLTKGKVTNISTDYKKLAKEYYESIKTTKVETKEKKSNIVGTYETASSDMKTTTVTEIETKTKLESGKKITEASVVVSAGADQRKMPLETAKQDWESKMAALKEFKNKFTTTTNKTEIQKIIDEISKTNIESNITDAGSDKKNNNEQHGNRYLIAARIAEGFIKALDTFTLQPEPKLTLTIDRKNCSIGKINSDNEDDRFIHMNIDIKAEATKKDEQQVNTQEQKKAGTRPIIEIGKGKKQQSSTGTGNQNDKGGPRVNDSDVIDEQGTQKEQGTGTGGTTEGTEKGQVTGTGKKVEGRKQENKTAPEVKEYMESKEITMLKNDVADHFMLKGENLVNGDVSDVEQDNTNPQKYTATIKGYTQVIIEYKDKNIEISQGTVTKGLLKWNTNNPKTIIDRYTKDKKKENITITFSAEKSKTYINEKLNKSTTGDQGKYEIKQASDVTEGQIIVYYKNTTILEKKADKDIDDKITIKLDAKDYTVKQDAVSNVATQRQKAEGTEKELRTTKDTYYIDNNTEKKLTYYAKTTGGSKTTDISIINNLRKIEGSNHISIFPAYDNIYRVKETAEKYAEKVQLVYETPNVTTVEKQFKNTANIQWIKDSTYNIVTDFTIANNTPANRLEIPITYIPGDSKNGNVSSIKNESAPKLSLKDDYNKVIDERTLMIDGIVYDITFPISKAGNVPNIVFAHNTTKTLTETKKYTDKYAITSNIFTDTYENNIELLNHVNSGMGKVTYGPLIVKDNKREDPITYYKEAYVGQVINKGTITNQGTKLTTIYFDQYGKYKNHELNPEFMTLPNQTPKSDVVKHTPQIVKDPVGQAAKNINITSNRDGKENIAINMMNYREIYDADQKGEDFIKQKAPNLAKDMDNNFYTKEMLRTNIAKGRVAMFNGLKKISSHNISPESQKLFNLDPITEKSTDTDVIKGPDRKGIYTYEIIKDHKSKNGKKEYPPQNIYSKVSTAGEIILCNAKGETINEQNIYLQASDDYYTLKLSDNKKEFKIIGKKEEAQRQSPKVEIAIDKDMEVYKGDLQIERNCSYQAELSNNKFDYEFNNKYTSFAVEVERKDNEVTIGGKDKITDKGSFSLVDSKEENFGLYEDFFTTPDSKSLGIDEKTYEKVFKELFAKYETNTDKTLVKVKYLHKGKYYYAPMYLDISKRGDKNMFNLEMSEGRKKTNEEIERRLSNMVKSRTINLEQDMTNKQKGENMLGWYLVKPNVETLTKYFENPSQEKIEFYLQTNNTVGGKFVAQKMNFMTKEEDIDEKKITIDNVEYKLSFTKVGKEYKIIVRKGDVVAQ